MSNLTCIRFKSRLKRLIITAPDTNMASSYFSSCLYPVQRQVRMTLIQYKDLEACLPILASSASSSSIPTMGESLPFSNELDMTVRSAAQSAHGYHVGSGTSIYLSGWMGRGTILRWVPWLTISGRRDQAWVTQDQSSRVIELISQGNHLCALEGR